MSILLANPRGFCAGVVRAIDAVETALQSSTSPVYVLHEIVHNQHVISDLTQRGVRFVEQLDQVPDGSTLVLSAHGVSLQVEQQAEARRLSVIDATCPLVGKVHRQVEHHARQGYDVILIGHAGHAEVIGTMGHFDAHAGTGKIHLIATVEEAESLTPTQADRLAYVTQTTLSVDDTARVVGALRQRFPSIIGPRKDDICYASQNRQQAVREIAPRIDLLLVVGARNSSNSTRLRELGEQLGVESYLVQDASEIEVRWLSSERRVGITAGASAPELLVSEVIDRLAQCGIDKVSEVPGAVESTKFALPIKLELNAVRVAMRQSTAALSNESA